jgi:Xaa-Pro aminopeptidase
LSRAAIFLLSGVDQEESILLLFPDPYEHHQKKYYLKETNDHIAVWEGEN